MDTSYYFLQNIKRISLLFLALVVLLVVLLNQQFAKEIEDKNSRSVDSAIAADAQLELLIAGLRRSTAIFTQQYAPLIRLSQNDQAAALELQKLVFQYFNHALSYMVTNQKGDYLTKGLSNLPGTVCKNDINHFLSGIDHEVSVHSTTKNVHFDIMHKWENQGVEGAFVIIFDINFIKDLLGFHQTSNHFLVLMDKDKPEQIELLSSDNTGTYNSEALKKQTLFETPITGSRWSLLALRNEANYNHLQQKNYQQIAIIISLFVLIIVVGLWLLSKQMYKNSLLKEKEQLQQLIHETLLQSLVEGTAEATGEAFYYSLVKELSRYMQVDRALIAFKLEGSKDDYQTQAYWHDDSFLSNTEIHLPHEICNQSTLCCVESGFSDQYPEVLLSTDTYIDGFIAIELFNAIGEKIGVLCVMDAKPIAMTKRKSSVLKIFAAKAETEFNRQTIEEELIFEKGKAQTTLRSIGEGVITTDSKGMIDFMNPVAERLTGWSNELAYGLSLPSVFHLEDEETGNVIPDPSLRCMQEKRTLSPNSSNILVSKNSNRYSIKGSASPMFVKNGECVGSVIVFNDVTHSRQLEKMMQFQASHDALTGLVNRNEFERRLESAFQSAKEFQHQHALLYLDLDQFKIVNDTAGHIAGDELLIQVSNLLLEQLRGRDTLGRLGGDEFSVLLEHCPVSEATHVANNLIDSIKEFHFIWEKSTYQIGVSIGLVPIDEHSLSTVQIMTQADLACYTAKDKGRGQAHVFVEDDAEVANRHRDLLRAADLKQAIKNERFELFFQPIVGLSDNDISIHGEVLLRLLDEHGEHVLPGAFIPAAERYGVMDQIDRWVLNKIFTEYIHIFDQNPNLLLSINLSGNSLSDVDLLDDILQLFDDSGVNPNQVCFEITETAAINSYKQLNQFMKVLQKVGCSFALDDFGSGLSSFNYLKKMRVDYLKIDGQFIKDLVTDEVDKAMVKSINEMGHVLGIKTIAEYADNEDILLVLKELNVDFAQGYYLGGLEPLESLGLQVKGQPEEQHVIN